MSTNKNIVTDGAFYRFVTANDYALSVADSKADGILVTLDKADAKSAAQLWQAVAAADGAFALVNKATGKALSVVDDGEADGSWLHQWQYAQSRAQQWLVTAEGAEVRLVNLLSGKALDVVNGIAVQGAQTHLWSVTANAATQLWAVMPAEAKKPAAKKAAKPAAKAAAKPAAKAAEKPAAKAAEKPAAKAAEKPAAKAAAKPAAKAAEKPAAKAAAKTVKSK